MTEPALRCPGCGAPASADAAACDYCGSALATVTCPSCFAAMFAGSRFCARCGAEAVREVVPDDAPLPCPRCRTPMQALVLAGTTARECSTCGGLWLDPASLQRLADAREERAMVVGVLAGRTSPTPVPADVVRYVPCPCCARLMNRKNFAGSSGIVLDVCATHGVWLDRGELERLIGFIEGGGLSRARAHERERLAEEQRRLTVRQSGAFARVAPDALPLGAGTRGGGAGAPDDPLGRLLHDVLGFIGRL